MKTRFGFDATRHTLVAAYPVLLASGLLTGCIDEAPSPVTVDSALAVQTPVAGGPGPDMVISPRFIIDLDVDGALKPGPK